MATRILYLSQLIGKPVLDPQGQPVGVLGDLVARLNGSFPPVTGLTLRLGRIGRAVGPRATFLPWSQVASVDDRTIRLSSVRLDLEVFRRRPRELLLRADLLDQQVMDLNGRKLVRVNDVQIVNAPTGAADLRLAGVDVGVRGLARRLDLDRLAEWFSAHTPLQLPDRVIPWESIEPVDLTELSTDENGEPSAQALGIAEGTIGGAYEIQLSHERLSTLHPADVADLVEQLSAPERAAVMEGMEPEQAAEALGEMEPEVQGDLLEDLPTDTAVDILAELDPDEAADALAEVSDERADELLSGLDAQDAKAAAALRHLMTYEEDVAGGMMTTSYVALRSELTAELTIETLRQIAPPAEEVYYVYVVDDANRLIGVLSLRDLIVAAPKTKIGDIVRAGTEVVTIHPGDPEEEVLRVLEKYNLLAVPVTDDERHLLGVVTVDDALSAALPEEHRPGRSIGR